MDKAKDSPKVVCQRGYAKINLLLDVLDKRADGRHNLVTVMQTLRLWDEITVERVDPSVDGFEALPMVSFECNLKFLPKDDTNLAVRAAKLFLERTGLRAERIRLHLFKKIPVSAGLAGGSTDAAATLRALNRLYETYIPLATLLAWGDELGSDVPYCLIGGTCEVLGAGEIVKRITPMPESYVVLVKPDFGMSTARVYEKMDETEVERHPDANAFKLALQKRDVDGIAAQMVNVMEHAVFPEKKILRHMTEDLKRQGAYASLMSGSGSTVYGIFEKEKTAKAAYHYMKKYYGSRYTVLVTELHFPQRKERA